ncbi:MAG: hypothetical protein ACI8PZ_001785, partial [Myxococcota bacterium]
MAVELTGRPRGDDISPTPRHDADSLTFVNREWIVECGQEQVGPGGQSGFQTTVVAKVDGRITVEA